MQYTFDGPQMLENPLSRGITRYANSFFLSDQTASFFDQGVNR